MKALLALVLLGLSFTSMATTKVRIGWQVPWALQGQLVQIWKHTDILKKNGLEAEFVGKNYGPQLNEIALAGVIDVILTADQPAAALFSKDKGWVGISRLMYNRTTTYVPPKSEIKDLKDLKGKTVGVPFGAAAQRALVENLKNSGLDPKADVKFINLGMAEHGPLIKKAAADATKWDQFDALSGFDPIPAILEAQGLVRTIDTAKICSVVLMNKEFLSANKGVGKNIAKALKDAYAYYRKNRAEADAWFLEEAKLEGADPKALDLAAALEPNLKVKKDKDIKITFSEDDFKLMQKGADFVGETSGKIINMKDFVSNDYVK
ncbi:MAG: ABC transporter substrate-binding protein [Bacteriovorax sp.]|jgi:ABC-type nitrate/sulfonate/bicarbonate transport system substrate-binding protein